MAPCPFHPGKKRALPQQILWLGVPQNKTWCSGASQQKAVTQQSSTDKFSTRRIFTAFPLNSTFPLQLSPPSARHTRSRVNDSTSKMPGEEEEEEGMVSAGWAVHQYASRVTGSLALLLLAAAPFPHWLRLKPFSLDLHPSSWDLPLNYASFALPRVFLPKGSMWPMVSILV